MKATFKSFLRFFGNTNTDIEEAVKEATKIKGAFYDKERNNREEIIEKIKICDYVAHMNRAEFTGIAHKLINEKIRLRSALS